jgi:hypothetical protein
MRQTATINTSAWADDLEQSVRETVDFSASLFLGVMALFAVAALVSYTVSKIRGE